MIYILCLHLGNILFFIHDWTSILLELLNTIFDEQSDFFILINKLLLNMNYLIIAKKTFIPLPILMPIFLSFQYAYDDEYFQ